MLSIFPPPKSKENEGFAWDQLTIGVVNLDIHFVQPIVEDFWKMVVKRLSEIRDVNIQSPAQDAWFHVRRANKENKGEAANYAFGRIEVLRLRRGYVEEHVKKNIREMPQKYRGVICAGWWPLKFSDRHGNAFLSFLQKLYYFVTLGNNTKRNFLVTISAILFLIAMWGSLFFL